MQLIPIDQIHPSPGNARTIPTSVEADKALAASLATIGLLQPILVVLDLSKDGPITYKLRAGHRRFAAAQSLGWKHIPANILEEGPYGGAGSEVPETAISAAENMVRAPMHPVDQWRAIANLRDACGYSLETAAAALGVNLPLAKRLEHLGRMHPVLLERIGQGDLPENRCLRLIALAPHDVQLAAVERARPSSGYDRGNAYFWNQVAEACTCRRIPQSRAIFDPALMVWDEDLFAEPDDEDRFSTSETAKFLDLQREALEAQVAKAKGHLEIVPFDAERGRLNRPKGWRPVFAEIPKRWKKDDPRRAFATLNDSGWAIGEVAYTLCEPFEEREPETRSAPSKAGKPLISKKALAQLADLKAQAVRDRLTFTAAMGPSHMLHALLLAFTTRTVRASGLPTGPYSDLARRLVDPDGTPAAIEDETLCAMAADLIGQAMQFDAPDRFNSSGPGAEWLATAIGAELPRTDTDEVLKGFRGEALIALATEHNIPAKGTIGAVRKRLTGALPDWRAATFGAEGPAPADPRGSFLDDDEPELQEAAD